MDVLKLLLLASTPVLMINLAVELSLWTAVPGTRLRYVLATVRLVIGWNWALSNGLSFVVAVTEHKSAPMQAFGALAFVAGAIITRNIYTSHDDNWFSGRGRKIRRGLKRRADTLLSGLGPAPQTT